MYRVSILPDEIEKRWEYLCRFYCLYWVSILPYFVGWNRETLGVFWSFLLSIRSVHFALFAGWNRETLGVFVSFLLSILSVHFALFCRVWYRNDGSIYVVSTVYQVSILPDEIEKRWEYSCRFYCLYRVSILPYLLGEIEKRWEYSCHLHFSFPLSSPAPSYVCQGGSGLHWYARRPAPLQNRTIALSSSNVKCFYKIRECMSMAIC